MQKQYFNKLSARAIYTRPVAPIKFDFNAAKNLLKNKNKLIESLNAPKCRFGSKKNYKIKRLLSLNLNSPVSLPSTTSFDKCLSSNIKSNSTLSSDISSTTMDTKSYQTKMKQKSKRSDFIDHLRDIVNK